MRKRALILLAIAIAAALVVIDMRHRNRLHFVELQKLQAERDQLDTEWGRLLLEQGAWSEHRRIEGIARQQLGMVIPHSERVTVVYREAR